MRTILLLCLIAVRSAAAADLDALLGDGVFGTKWSSTLDEVRARMPGGEVKPGPMVGYLLNDGRTVFEIRRTSDDHILFAFEATKLIAVVISFTDCEAVTAKLLEFFGDPTDVVSNVVLGTWRGRDISLRLFRAEPSGCAVSIEKKRQASATTKDRLGLQ